MDWTNRPLDSEGLYWVRTTRFPDRLMLVVVLARPGDGELLHVLVNGGSVDPFKTENFKHNEWYGPLLVTIPAI